MAKSPASAGLFVFETNSPGPQGVFFPHLSLAGVATMLSWAIAFLVIALIAAVLGFGGIAGTAMSIAQLIFYVAILLFVIAVIGGVFAGRRSNL